VTAYRRVTGSGERLGPSFREHKSLWERAKNPARGPRAEGVLLAVVSHGTPGRVRHVLHVADQCRVLSGAVGGDAYSPTDGNELAIAVEQRAGVGTNYDCCLEALTIERETRWGGGGWAIGRRQKARTLGTRRQDSQNRAQGDRREQDGATHRNLQTQGG